MPLQLLLLLLAEVLGHGGVQRSIGLPQTNHLPGRFMDSTMILD